MVISILGEWVIPNISGQCMPPNAFFVMEAITNTRAIIYGGRDENLKTTYDTIYIVEINHSTCTLVSCSIFHSLH